MAWCVSVLAPEGFDMPGGHGAVSFEKLKGMVGFVVSGFGN